MTEKKPSKKKRRTPPPTKADHQGILDRIEDLGLLDHPEFAIDVLKTFVRDGFNTMERLERAIQDGQCRACEELAHRLTGASRNLGAERLGQIALALENLGREGDLSSAGPLLKELRKEFEGVRVFISQLPGKSKAA